MSVTHSKFGKAPEGWGPRNVLWCSKISQWSFSSTSLVRLSLASQGEAHSTGGLTALLFSLGVWWCPSAVIRQSSSVPRRIVERPQSTVGKRKSHKMLLWTLEWCRPNAEPARGCVGSWKSCWARGGCVDMEMWHQCRGTMSGRVLQTDSTAVNLFSFYKLLVQDILCRTPKSGHCIVIWCHYGALQHVFFWL